MFLLTKVKLVKPVQYSRKYENTLLMGNFNVEPDETNMKAFCNQRKLKSLDKANLLYNCW